MYDRYFEDKVAIVTGGSSGIGRTTAIVFAKAGVKVVVAARRAKEGLETVVTIKEAGGQGIFVRTDVTSASDVASLVEQTISTYGRLDFAVNNAGGGNPVPLLEETEEHHDAQIASNLKSVWLCLKHEVPAMLKSGGSIVNISSTAGIMGVANHSSYGAAKSGVTGLTRCAAVEFADSNIRINSIAVGPIHTEGGWGSTSQNELEEITRGIALRRFGKPEHIAHTALWLCSEFGDYVTGQCIPVDAGVSTLLAPNFKRTS